MLLARRARAHSFLPASTLLAASACLSSCAPCAAWQRVAAAAGPGARPPARDGHTLHVLRGAGWETAVLFGGRGPETQAAAAPRMFETAAVNGSLQGPRPRAQGLLAIDDEWGTELLRKLVRSDPAEKEARPLDAGGVGEEVDHLIARRWRRPPRIPRASARA